MRQVIPGLGASLLFCAAVLAQGPLDTSTGQSLAQAIRSAEPDEDSNISGTLIIHSNNAVLSVPLVCRVFLHDGSWETDYDTTSAGGIPAESLVVRHSTNGPNQYFFARAGAPGQVAPKPAPIPISDSQMPLAGSDFSIGDLSLQFLHWPEQQRLRDQDRLGRACYVLESSNPMGGEIVRVKSYIDKQTGGILVADAFDAQGRTVKTFSLHGSSFKKINGQWRLQKMEIVNRRTHSRTELKFNLNGVQ